MDMEMNDFQPASKLNKAQRKLAQRAAGAQQSTQNQSGSINKSKLNLKEPDLHNRSLPQNNEPDQLSPEHLIRLMNGAMNFLREQPEYFDSFGKVLDEAITDTGIQLGKIVCYGLGSFGYSMTSRFQLALLLQLNSKLNLPIEIYDPLFSPNEKQVLSQEYNCVILEKNEEGKRLICPQDNCPTTLFYLPHAPHQLVNNLLYTNWNELNLPHIVLICNSFTRIRESTPKRGLSENLTYIDRAGAILTEYGIINSFHYYEVFNDLALHAFPQKLVQDRKYETEFWVRGSEPTYKSLDYVKASDDNQYQ